MRRAETLGALALVIVALVLLREAVRLPIRWTETGPGSGFFPFWLSVGVTLTAVTIFVQTLRPAPAENGEAFVPAGAWKPLLAVFLPMGAVIAFLGSLGIYLGGAIYLAGYTWFVGRHRLRTILLVSVLVPLVLFFIFEKWFLLPLPKGSLLEYLLYER